MTALQAQMTAMCKLLQDDGHMTPVATRQILAVTAAMLAATEATIATLATSAPLGKVNAADGRREGGA